MSWVKQTGAQAAGAGGRAHPGAREEIGFLVLDENQP